MIRGKSGDMNRIFMPDSRQAFSDTSVTDASHTSSSNHKQGITNTWYLCCNFWVVTTGFWPCCEPSWSDQCPGGLHFECLSNKQRLRGLRFCGAASCEVGHLLWMKHQNCLKYRNISHRQQTRHNKHISQYLFTLHLQAIGVSEVLQSEPSICQAQRRTFHVNGQASL